MSKCLSSGINDSKPNRNQASFVDFSYNIREKGYSQSTKTYAYIKYVGEKNQRELGRPILQSELSITIKKDLLKLLGFV